MIVRRALFAALIVVTACGVVPEGRTLSGGAAPTASGSPPLPGSPAVVQRTLPPDDPSLKGCIADWAEGFRSLPPLVDRASVIVRATAVSSQTSAERWSTGYRTTLRVDRALKGAPGKTITVIESACPAVYGGPAEWVLFLAAKLDDPAIFNVVGGIQGAFPLRGGRIAPVYRDAYLVRTYTGVPVADLEGEVARIRPLDGDAAALLHAKGWNMVGTWMVREYELPAAIDFGQTKIPPRYERPFEGYARIAAITGLDLRPFGGRTVEEIGLLLERVPASDQPWPPVARLVYVDRRYVGGWVQVGASDSFRLDDRAAALATTPKTALAPTPAPNRYPSGVNVVAEYGLAKAAWAYVKPLVPGAKAVPAPPLADLLAALDRSYPTESPPPRTTEGYWVVGFVIGDHYIPFEYHADTGQLVQRDDGYAIRVGAWFADLIGAPRR